MECILKSLLLASSEKWRPLRFLTRVPGSGLGGGGGVTWVNFCWVCATSLSEPLPHYSLFCGRLYTPSLSLLGKYVIFAIPTFRLNKEHFTFHPQYKHSGTFANRKYEELSYPKNKKCAITFWCLYWKCDPIQQHIPISLL